MDYREAARRFSFVDFISQIKDLDLLSVTHETSKEINIIERTIIPRKSLYKNDIDYLKSKYLSDLKDFSGIINQGIRHNNIDEESLKLMQQVVVELVNKGMLKNGILEIFE